MVLKEAAQVTKKLSSGLLHLVVWWLEGNVLEAVLPPSSGFKFVIKEMHPLHCCPPLNYKSEK
jgi:hypothetical protein